MANALCINVKLFDAIAEHGCGVTLEQAHELLPAIPPSKRHVCRARTEHRWRAYAAARGADDHQLREGRPATCRSARTARQDRRHATQRNVRLGHVTHMRRMHSTRWGMCRRGSGCLAIRIACTQRPTASSSWPRRYFSKGLAVAIDAGGLRAQEAAALASAMPV
jgi:hypothetical protein